MYIYAGQTLLSCETWEGERVYRRNADRVAFDTGT